MFDSKAQEILLYLIGAIDYKDGEYSRIGESEFHEAMVEEQMKKRICVLVETNFKI